MANGAKVVARCNRRSQCAVAESTWPQGEQGLPEAQVRIHVVWIDRQALAREVCGFGISARPRKRGFEARNQIAAMGQLFAQALVNADSARPIPFGFERHRAIEFGVDLRGRKLCYRNACKEREHCEEAKVVEGWAHLMARFSKAFGPKALFVAFDAFGDLLFFNSKKK